jgi:hypothetical protein
LPPDIPSQERRLAIDAIATLAYRKNDLYQYPLAPAGVPLELVRDIARRRDALGQRLTKRAIAPRLLDRMHVQPGDTLVERGIIQLAARWSRLDIARNETAAHDIILRARGMLSTWAAEEAEGAARRAAEQEAQA